MSQELEFEVRDRLSVPQVDDLVRLYGNEWWSKDRTRPDVEKMLLASDLLIAVVEKGSKSLAAFARVLTDGTYVALVFDVIVAPEYRGRGVGRLLLERICAEPALRNVASIELHCQPEHIPFYRKWGFSEEVGRSRLMRRTSDLVLGDGAAQGTAAARCAATQEAAAAGEGGQSA